MGIFFHLFILLMVGWIGLIIAFNYYKLRDDSSGTKYKDFIVYSRFKSSMGGMEFGELIACVITPIMIGVVLYDSVKSGIVIIVSRIRSLFSKQESSGYTKQESWTDLEVVCFLY